MPEAVTARSFATSPRTVFVSGKERGKDGVPGTHSSTEVFRSLSGLEEAPAGPSTSLRSAQDDSSVSPEFPAQLMGRSLLSIVHNQETMALLWNPEG